MNIIKILSNIFKLSTPIQRLYCTTKKKRYYTIPNDLRDAFFLANAPLHQQVNYYVHEALEHIFTDLTLSYEEAHPVKSDQESGKAVRELMKRLGTYDLVVDGCFPLKKASGSFEILRSWRVYHGLSLNNICSGGMIVADDVEIEHSRGFAILSMFRNALLGLDWVGSNGGIKVNSCGLTPEEMDQCLDNYGQLICGSNENIDLIEPDAYCNVQEMKSLKQSLENQNNVKIIGTNQNIDGTSIYSNYGVDGTLNIFNEFVSNSELMGQIHFDPLSKDKAFIIRGLGKLGLELARRLIQSGYRCVGIHEVDAQIYDENGIDLEDLISYKTTHGTIIGYKEKTHSLSKSETILTNPCHLLVLSDAITGVSTSGTNGLPSHLAPKVQANIILEASNCAIPPMTHKILTQRGKLVIPDILASTGYAAATYLEYVAPISTKNAKIEIDKNVDVMKQMQTGLMKDMFKIRGQYQLNLDFRASAYIRGLKTIFAKLVRLQDSDKVDSARLN